MNLKVVTAALIFVVAFSAPVQAQVAAYDRMHMRDIYILAITDSETLSVGSHLVINFPDTGESQTVEIVDISNIGQDLEICRHGRHPSAHAPSAGSRFLRLA